MRTVWIKLFYAAVSVSMMIPTFAYAEELPLFYEGIRPLGMGGAFTAVADDENALFYNPAGLNQGEMKGFRRFDLLKPTAEFSNEVIDFLNDIQAISSAPQSQQFVKTTDLVNKWIGQGLYIKGSFLSDIIFHNFGIGLLAQASMNGSVHNPLSSQTLNLKATGDMALLVSKARQVKIKERPVMVGITAKAINRQQVNLSYSIREIAEQKFDPFINANKEVGFALDIGALYPMQGAMKPVVGIAIQNIVGGDLGSAGELPSQVNLGVSLRPKVRYGKIVLAADIMDATLNLGDDNDIAKRLHLGLEYRLPRMLTLRTGLYQGYPSLGATIDFWLAKLAYAYYTEEVGAFSGQTPDQRQAIQFSLGY